MCLNISTVINIKILTNSNQQTQSYKFTSHISAFPSVVLITEMLEICIQTSYDQNVQLIFKELSPCSVWYHLKLFSFCFPQYDIITESSLYTPGSSTNKTDRHDITEILLKVALNTITPSIITDLIYDSTSFINSLIVFDPQTTMIDISMADKW